MSAILNPYLNFRGQAREAMEFYASVFGGELTVSTFGEYQMTEVESEKNLVMHSQFTSPSGLTLMGADVPEHMPLQPGTTVSCSLSGDDRAALTQYWEALSDGATVHEPLTDAPWGDAFGMLTDRFGIQWLVNIAGSGAPQG